MVLIVILQCKLLSIESLMTLVLDGKGELFWIPPITFGAMSTIAGFLSLLLQDRSSRRLTTSILEITLQAGGVLPGLNLKEKEIH